MSRLPIVSCETEPTETVSDPIPLAARGTAGVPGWLADRQGRRLRYLRLSVTDRCDLRCQYCMPVDGVPASAKEDVLEFEEIIRVVRIFQELGVQTVRLTGGEPLVRRELPELVRMLRDQGVEDIALTTNATALRVHAPKLVQAGLSRINVSVDSVRPETFRSMTRGGDLSRVIQGIDAAREAGIGELKTNSVVVRGANDDQLPEIVEWAWGRQITPRFIELMPLGEAARLGRHAVVPVAEMKATLAPLLASEGQPDHRLDRGPAGYVEARVHHGPMGDGFRRTVGFIGAVTDNFCQRCNRIRITARGEVRACLASPEGLSLRDAFRQGLSDAQVLRRVEDALFGKRHGHQFYMPGVTRHFDVHMSRIGG